MYVYVYIYIYIYICFAVEASRKASRQNPPVWHSETCRWYCTDVYDTGVPSGIVC